MKDLREIAKNYYEKKHIAMIINKQEFYVWFSGPNLLERDYINIFSITSKVIPHCKNYTRILLHNYHETI